jgi:tRNA threonylcarbamoyladenosine biosynthesis protein TsaB
MLALGIQTVLGAASVGLLKDGALVAEKSIGERFAVCRLLASEIKTLLADSDNSAEDIGLIAVCLGPGSFTGIRIGTSTAKALAHAIGCRIIGVNALEAIASMVEESHYPVSVMLAAGRGRYFAAQYDKRLTPLREPTVLSAEKAEEWISSLEIVGGGEARGEELARRLILYGEKGPHLQELASRLGAEIRECLPTGKTIARLALEKLERVDSTDPVLLQPFYLRSSSPEERTSATVD